MAVLVLAVAVATVAPVHRYNVREQPFYEKTLARIAPFPVRTDTQLAAGASVVSITPNHPTATAGYGKRRGAPFTHILDSVYVRTLVLSNGGRPVAIVAADLLIIPPAVRIQLESRLPEAGYTIDNVFLGATHSHNSVGHWAPGIAARMYGAYQDSVVRFLTDRILESVRLASRDLQPARAHYLAVRAPEAVSNRLNPGGVVDSLMHAIQLVRSDKKRFLLTTFAAHATCHPPETLALSRDYPGLLVDELERSGFDHVQFLAGAAGSQATRVPDDAASCSEWTARTLALAFRRDSAQFETLVQPVVQLQRVAIDMPPAQARISQNWRLRPWVFHALMGESPGELTALRIGNVLMVGTPCDFSAELMEPLYRHARAKQVRLLVTSFNGGYMGYITPDAYYDKDHYETRLMNWHGPGNGTFFSDCILKFVDLNFP
jgi:hypothetical protein